MCILYGFAKLNGSQFTVLDSELAKPMGEVSGDCIAQFVRREAPTPVRRIKSLSYLTVHTGQAITWQRRETFRNEWYENVTRPS